MGPRKAAASKGKQDQEVDAAAARSILHALDKGQALPQDVALRLLRCNQPPCPPACGTKGHKGNKDNPTCTCALVPPEGSFRKKGLWRKDHSSDAYGSDPASQRREDPNHPPGLRNLGNTCYVSATLQMLGAIPLFRQALYALEAGLVGSADFVAQLRDVYLQLEHGPRSVVDPEPFARSLQLDHSIQQDGQEFLKLLLMQLETVFGASSNQAIASVLQQLFAGGFSFVTTCKACGRSGEASQRVNDFTELSLQVQDHTTLLESLVSLLSPEELVGDNQYDCAFCAGKRDATRQMVLRRLPPFLSLSLQRFVFDQRTFDKKKLTSKLTFPEVLTLDPALQAAGVPPDQWPATPLGPLAAVGSSSSSSEGGPGALYDLQAVLLHKGNSASHGHYVAHVRSPVTGDWWRYDDETTEKMTKGPTSAPADHGTTASAAAAANGEGGSDNEASKGASKSSKAKAGSSKAGSSKGGRGGAGGKGRGKGKGRGSSKRGKHAAAIEEDDGDDEGSQLEAGLGLAMGDYVEDDEAAAVAAVEALEAAKAAAEAEEVAAAIAAVDAATTAAAAAAAAGGGGKPGGRRCGANKRVATPPAPAAAAPVDASAVAKADGVAEGSAVELADGAATPGQQQQQQQGAVPGSASEAAGASTTDQPPPGAIISSGNAYLLVYRLRGWQPPPNQQQLLGVGSSAEQLPDELQAALSQLRNEYEAQVQGHATMQAEAAARVEARQQEVRFIRAELQPQGPDSGEPHLISAAWLEEWANADSAPPAIDNTPVMCSHGKLDPNKVAQMKLISGTAWGQLQAGCGGGPELTLADVCPVCVRGQLQQLISRSLAQDTRGTLLQELEACEEREEEELDPDSLFVSRTWLAGFKKRTTLGANQAAPTAAITCCHGHLMPDQGSKRTALPPHVFSMLVEYWARDQATAQLAPPPARKGKGAAAAAAAEEEQGAVSDVEVVEVPSPAANGPSNPAAAEPAANGHPSSAAPSGTPADQAGDAAPAQGPSPPPATASLEELTAAAAASVKRFHLGSEECPICVAGLRSAVEQQQEVKGALEEERAALSSLASGSIVLQLEPGEAYYLLPNSWLAAWQVYISAATSKKVVGITWTPVQRPPPLPEVLRPLLCGCGGHPGELRLKEAPPAVVNKRGRFQQADKDTDALRIITAAEWQKLLRFHSGVDLNDLLRQHLDQQQQQQQQQDHNHQQLSQQGGQAVEAVEIDTPTGGSGSQQGRSSRRLHHHHQQQQQQQQQQQLPSRPTRARGAASSEGGGPRAQALEALEQLLWQQAVEQEPLLKGIQAYLILEDPAPAAAAPPATAAAGDAAAAAAPSTAPPSQPEGAAAAAPLGDDVKPGSTARVEGLIKPSSSTGAAVKQEKQPPSSPLRAALLPSAAASAGSPNRSIWPAASGSPLAAASGARSSPRSPVTAAAGGGNAGGALSRLVHASSPCKQQPPPPSDVVTGGAPAASAGVAGGSSSRGVKRSRDEDEPATAARPGEATGGAAAAAAAGPKDVVMQDAADTSLLDLTADKGEEEEEVEQVDLSMLSDPDSSQQPPPTAAAAAGAAGGRRGTRGSRQQAQAQPVAPTPPPPAAAAAAAGGRVRGRATRTATEGVWTAINADMSSSEDDGIRYAQRQRRKRAQEDEDWCGEGSAAAEGEPSSSSSLSGASGGGECMFRDDLKAAGLRPSRGRSRGTAGSRQLEPRRGAAAAGSSGGEGGGSRRGRGRRRSGARGSGMEYVNEQQLLADLEEEERAASVAAAAAHLQGRLVTIPAVCEAHLEAAARAAREAALTYFDQQVMVEQVAAAELATAFNTTGAERKSRRARKGRQPVVVSCTTSLHELKLRIFEVLGVHPKNQLLYTARGALEGDEATLGQLEVLPEEEVRVVSSGQFDDDDYASAFDGAAGGSKNPREVEVGFKNTVLGGRGAGAVAAAAAKPSSSIDEPAGTAGKEEAVEEGPGASKEGVAEPMELAE